MSRPQRGEGAAISVGVKVRSGTSLASLRGQVSCSASWQMRTISAIVVNFVVSISSTWSSDLARRDPVLVTLTRAVVGLGRRRRGKANGHRTRMSCGRVAGACAAPEVGGDPLAPSPPGPQPIDGKRRTDLGTKKPQGPLCLWLAMVALEPSPQSLSRCGLRREKRGWGGISGDWFSRVGDAFRATARTLSAFLSGLRHSGVCGCGSDDRGCLQHRGPPALCSLPARAPTASVHRSASKPATPTLADGRRPDNHPPAPTSAT